MMWTVLCSSDQLMDTLLTCIIFTATMNRSLIDHNESFMGGHGNDIKRETWTTEKPWHVKRSFRSAQWPAHGDNQSGCRVWAGAMLYCQSLLAWMPHEPLLWSQESSHIPSALQKLQDLLPCLSVCLTAVGICMGLDETYWAIVHGHS